MYAPDALRMKSGVPPTALNARTGLSTPPGRICWARAKSFADLGLAIERQIDELKIEIKDPLNYSI
jgi:hypothetical protein